MDVLNGVSCIAVNVNTLVEKLVEGRPNVPLIFPTYTIFGDILTTGLICANASATLTRLASIDVLEVIVSEETAFLIL